MICCLCTWFGPPSYRSRPCTTLSCSLHPLPDLYVKGQFLYKNLMNVIFILLTINAHGVELILTSWFVPFSLSLSFCSFFPHLSFQPNPFSSEILPPTLIHFLQQWTSERQERDTIDKYIYGVRWNMQQSYWSCLYSIYILMPISYDIYSGDFFKEQFVFIIGFPVEWLNAV